MNFALTDALTDKIISAMDNQEQKFLVDAIAGDLVLSDSIESSKSVDSNKINEIYYELPDWKPADGFTVRENFVNNLHSPLAREELQVVLHSGRGVFKNYRAVLKKYPEIDKRWHIYKHRIMSARINEWYNSLREVWGLEKLDQFSESEESIAFDDFSFDEYDSESYKEILLNINAEYSGCEPENTEIPYEVNSALQKLYLKLFAEQFEQADNRNHTGFICHSLSDDFAGCITAAPILNNQENIMVITSLFVPESFRGLGIATELISLLFSKLHKDGKQWILMPNSITPELLEPLLTRLGFEKIRFGYMAEIH